MSYEMPLWLSELFLKFSVGYEGLWNYNMKSDAEILGKKLLWFGALNGFNENAIYSAIDLAISHHPRPPAIADMVQICQSESRKLNDNLKKIENVSSLPSKLLASYMGKYPIKSDDPFYLIFSNYQGKERGTETIKEIKNQLRGSFMHYQVK